MKKSLALFALLLGAVSIPTISKAQPPSFSLCIHDGFGYVWSFTVTRDGDVNNGKGTVDLGGDLIWDASGWFNRVTGATSLRADNPQADGCFSGYTDYFQYDGSAKADKNGGVATYDGSGGWKSYCSGSVFNVGTWDATDCDHKNGYVNPNGPARHITNALIKVSPNPITNHASVSYSLVKAGNVNVTVYNSMQQPVKVLVNGYKNVGNYTVTWDAKSSKVNAGVYRVVAVVNGKTYSTTVQVIQ